MMPPLMNNHGNFIVSLGSVCRWLATKAEALGVEIYPGFAGAEVLTDDEGRVIGVATGDMGVTRSGEAGPSYQRGMALLGKYTLIAEGARGSLAKELIRRFNLDEGRDPRKVRHRPEGALGGRSGEAPARPRPAQLWLAARPKDRRRLVPLSFRREPRVGRVRRPPELRQSVSRALRGVPALQDASGDRRRRSLAASAFPTARAPSPKAVGRACRNWRFRAAR